MASYPGDRKIGAVSSHKLTREESTEFRTVTIIGKLDDLGVKLTECIEYQTVNSNRLEGVEAPLAVETQTVEVQQISTGVLHDILNRVIFLLDRADELARLVHRLDGT